MLAIPVPFVVSMLLGLLAITLYLRFERQTKAACLFLGLCATTIVMVGLRWTFDVSLFNFFQPVLASLIPVCAWFVFSASTRRNLWSLAKHFVAPAYILTSVATQDWLSLPIDEVLTLTYIGYGIGLIRFAGKESLLINVSLGSWDKVKKAESIAGWMLLFSALVDTLMSLDFAYNKGEMSLYILTVAHLVLLPTLSIAVVIVGINTPISETENAEALPDHLVSNTVSTMTMSQERAIEITSLLDEKIRRESLYLDPDLTLAKLSRKLVIPAKHISIAVNQIHAQNISKLINSYRVCHAKQALRSSQDTVTQIFMNSGFQTKSNFNREFSRITGMTPSQYRKAKSAQQT
ncbi:AraC family transcriptional regulator [Vibrio tubiashii]|uniref:helix-turn-helix domain-containing protein n=1 Tax=Vibrio tubiashii TaxID=29498 RepID=UPI001EFD3BC7|nr:AraC family transcriptional regulator [Vibrio tubiashii]MCG9580279.1 AraC family transcriptional regulator [Vibrio tubiashii]MCG9613870.1 AraC family transcriptional regulator [Vibrio tubiashii]MCG9688022.1 AraC family transcriptional regulator [Vibrio tubiashii]